MSDKDKILEKGQKAAKIATISTIFLVLIKGAAGVLSGSLLLIADAVHSSIDVLSIFSSWFGLKISRKKYSEKFPYGYYKAENFATLIASFFIFYAAYGIFIESYGKFFIISSLDMPIIALVVPLISSVISYFIAVYEEKIGKEIKSQSLIANAQDTKIDVISSLIIFGGILLSYFNIGYIESIIGMGLSLMILKIGFQNAKIAIYSLMDAGIDKNLEKSVRQNIMNFENVKDVDSLKLRQSGLFIFGEAKIKMLKNINVERAHGISDLIEGEIKRKFPEIESLMIHIEPFKPDKFKILIPTADDHGLDSEIIDHFGRAKYFLFVYLKNEKIISFYVKKNINIQKKIRAGLSSSKNNLDEKIDILLTKKIGEISFHTLRDSFVDIYFTESRTAKQAIDDFIKNKLKKLNKPTHSSDK